MLILNDNIIDNYDSFTYNLVQYFGSINTNIEVYKNDNISIDEIKMKKPKGIVISGPEALKMLVYQLM